MKKLVTTIFAVILCSCGTVPIIEPTAQNVHSFFTQVKKGDIELVQDYLDAGMDVDVRNHEEFGAKTGLMVAAKRMKPEMVEFLLENGADPNAIDNDYNTAISEACKVSKKGVSKQIILFLIKNGAKVDPIAIEGKKMSSNNPLMNAIENNNLEAVEVLLENNVKIKGSENNQKRVDATPLDIAITNFNNEIAKRLIKKGVCKNKKNASSAILTAIKSENLEMIEILLDFGIDPNVITEDSYSPLMAAIFLDNPNVIEMLIKKGADLKDKDEDGNSVLHHASRYGNLKAAKVLLKNGMDVDIRNDKGETPSMMANQQKIQMNSMMSNMDFNVPPENESDEAKRKRMNRKLHKHYKTVEKFDNAKLLKFLLKKDADVNAKDKEGKSILTHMVTLGLINSCKELINRKADVNAKDKTGKTVLMYAKECLNKPIYELLVKNGAKDIKRDSDGDGKDDYADINLDMPALTDLKMSQSALRMKPGKGHYGALSLPGIYESRSGAGRNKKISEEEKKRLARLAKLPKELFNASAKGDNEKIKNILKEKGLDINAKDDGGLWKTPLIHAIENNHLSTAELLIDNGADVNKERAHGITPLFEAVKADNPVMVKMLLEKGAKTLAFDENSGSSFKGEYKFTPFMDTLINSIDYQIAGLLLQNGADINSEYDENMSLLAVVAYSFNHNLLNLLLSNGADISAEDDFTVSLINLLTSKYDKVDFDIKNEAGMNLFHYAVMNGEIEMADQLLKKGLDINSTMRNGNSALLLVMMDVLENDSFDTVEWLIEKGIDVKTKNKQGYTCMDMVDSISEAMEEKFVLYRGEPETDAYFKKEFKKLEKFKNIIRKAESQDSDKTNSTTKNDDVLGFLEPMDDETIKREVKKAMEEIEKKRAAGEPLFPIEEKIPPEPFCTILIYKDKYMIGKEEKSIEDINNMFREFSEKDKERLIIFKATPDARHQMLVKLLDSCMEAALKNIQVVNDEQIELEGEK